MVMVLPQDAPYDDGANIAMNHDGGGGDNVVNISPPIIVIENISSVSHVAINGNIDPAPDADHNVDGVVVVVDSVGEAAAVIADDEASAASHLLSLSSATSATSIASTLSDGVSRPRSQQRPHQHHELPLSYKRSRNYHLKRSLLVFGVIVASESLFICDVEIFLVLWQHRGFLEKFGQVFFVRSVARKISRGYSQTRDSFSKHQVKR